MQRYLRLASYFLSLMLSTGGLFAQTGIQGTLTDEVGDPIIGGNVKVFTGDAYVTGAATDYNGDYRLSLDPGEYDVEFSYVGYDPQRIEGIEATEGSILQFPFKFEQTGLRLGEARPGSSGCIFRPNPIDVSETTQGMIIHSRELRRVSKPN